MSHRNTMCAGLLIAALAASPAAAWHYGVMEPPRPYTLLKAGGYGLNGVGGGEFDNGLFLGAETGVSLSSHLEFGVSIDWFHRRHMTTDVLLIDSSYDLPIEGRVDVDGSSTDLVPLGAGLRVRFPLADGRLAPFVAGQITFDLLRLTSQEVAANGGTIEPETRTDWFFGPGGTFTLGVEARLDPRFGLLVEAGAHGSEPSKELLVNNTPVRGHVVTDGEFARVGLRLGF